MMGRWRSLARLISAARDEAAREMGTTPPSALRRVSHLVNEQPDPLRPPHEPNPAIPETVSAVLMQALSIQFKHRPANATVLRVLLRTAPPSLVEAPPTLVPTQAIPPQGSVPRQAPLQPPIVVGMPTIAADHDVQPELRITPVGFLLPATNELFVYGVTSRVTSDCLVDLLHLWWESVRDRFADIMTLVITLDNGPERQSLRPQFLHRIVPFAHHTGVTVNLASYPPYSGGQSA